MRKRTILTRLGMNRYARSSWAEGAKGTVLGVESTKQGKSFDRVIREIAEVPAPPAVAERLAVALDSTVLVRRRLVRIDGQPHQLADTYCTLEVAEGTMLRELETGPGGNFAELARAGHEPTTVKEEWAARMPSKAEADLLQLAPGTPVIDLIRTLKDHNDVAVEVMLSVIAADTTEMVYEFPVPD